MATLTTLVTCIVVHVHLFVFGKYCPPVCTFKKNIIRMFVRVLSALYIYDFFEISSSVRLFPTVPQFKSLEYLQYSKEL